MARRLLALVAALCWLTLAGCARAPDAEPSAPAPATVECCASVAQRVVDTLPLPPPKLPAPAVEPLIPEQALDLIIAFEIGSPDVYTRKYRQPVWPGARSGATIGIGYDLGYQRADVIALDWAKHPEHARLQTAAGITGPVARDVVRKLADIAVDYSMAREVFDLTSVVEHYRIARRVFGAEHFDATSANVRGALTSIVFNRGGSMNGPSRVEMRAIRDDCLPRSDAACVARQVRAMVRIWKGSTIERGMTRRREAEAALAEAA